VGVVVVVVVEVAAFLLLIPEFFLQLCNTTSQCQAQAGSETFVSVTRTLLLACA
jgi:hypothetical protein